MLMATDACASAKTATRNSLKAKRETSPKKRIADARLIALGHEMQAKIAAYLVVGEGLTKDLEGKEYDDKQKQFDRAVDDAYRFADRVLRCKAQTFEGLIVRLRAAALLTWGEENPKAFECGQTPKNHGRSEPLYEIAANMVSILNAPQKPDPIFAAIEAHRAAWRGGEDQLPDADWSATEERAFNTLTKTLPTTIAGVGALAQYLAENGENRGDDSLYDDRLLLIAETIAKAAEKIGDQRLPTVAPKTSRGPEDRLSLVDPTFDLIKARHNAVNAFNECAEDQFPAKEAAYISANHALWNTAPTTFQGARAKVEYFDQLTKDEENNWTPEFVSTVLRNLLPEGR